MTSSPSSGPRSTSCARCSSSGCRWTLRHAYANVPHYRAAFDAAGVHPDDCKDLADLAKFPFTSKADLRENYPFGMFAVPARAGRAGPRQLRHHRPGHGGRLHQGRHRRLGHGDGPLDPGGGRPARPRPAHRVRLRAVHRRPRRALRGREARLHRDPGLRRDDRAPGHPDQGLRARHHHGHAVLHARDRRRDGAPGRRPGRVLAAVRHLRRRAVDERDARRDGGAGSDSTPSTSTACPR